jgi:hypothetical protein
MEERVGIIFNAASFDTSRESVVWDALDLSEFIFMAVPLKDCFHFFGILEDLSYFSRLLHGVMIGSIQIKPLVDKDDGCFVGRSELLFEPLNLGGREIGTVPPGIITPVGLHLGVVTGVENKEVNSAEIAGVMPGLVDGVGEILLVEGSFEARFRESGGIGFRGKAGGEFDGGPGLVIGKNRNYGKEGEKNRFRHFLKSMAVGPISVGFDCFLRQSGISQQMRIPFPQIILREPPGMLRS